MNVLDKIRTLAVAQHPSPAGAPRWQLVAAGAVAASVPWAVCLLLCVLGWMTAPQAPGGLGDVAALATAAWFVGTGGAVVASGAPLEVVPLGFWALAVWATSLVLRRALALAHPGERGGALPQALAREVLPLFAAGYALVALVLALSSLGGPVRPSVVALPLLLTVPAVGALLVLVLRPDGPQRAVRDALLDRVPLWVRRGLAPGMWAAAGLLGAGLLVALGAVGARFGTVIGLHQALDPGWGGGLLLVVGQVLYVPTLALWALGWLAGPGFQVAEGATVTLSGAQPGLLPLLPVLGAVPSEASYPGWVTVALLVPVLAGVVAGWRASRAWTRLASWRNKALTAAVAVATAVLPLGALAVLASGAAGTQRLSSVGVNPLLVTLALAGELAVGAAAYLLVDQARLRWLDSRLPQSQE